MARTRPRSISGARLAGLLAVAWVCLWTVLPATGRTREPLVDGPVVWKAADRKAGEVPEAREPGLVPYAVDSFVGRPFSRFWHPGRFLRWLGTGDRVPRAANVNALDEVVDSTWFTNRIGVRPLSDDELAAGPAHGLPLAEGPDRSRPWTIIGAKTAGVTPGFRIKDARGDVWLLKFDPPNHPGMTIRSGVVVNLLFHAMGFNTPVDRLVVFDRDELIVGQGAKMRKGREGSVPMTEANLDSILASTKSIFDGRFHALASRYLDGIPLGPFDDQDRRPDDPNDTIRHQDRRELRALKVFGAWVNHFDTKMHNSLDMYVGEPGEGFVRHFLIDFASTLGAYGDQPVRRFGFEYGLDVFPITGRLLTLGFKEDKWVGLERPAGLEEVGLIDVERFEPEKWKPDLPHSGMANLTRLDGYWAAKIVSAFTDPQLRLIVDQARYQNPDAAEFLVRTLAGRRDKIARYWFDRVPPLDFFRVERQGLVFHDLAVARGYAAAASTRYRYRTAAVDSGRGVQKDSGWTPWVEVDTTLLPILGADGRLKPGLPRGDADHRFLAVEVQLNRGDRWSASTTAYGAYGTGRIVAVDR